MIDDTSFQFEAKMAVAIIGEGYDGVGNGFGIAEEEVCVQFERKVVIATTGDDHGGGDERFGIAGEEVCVADKQDK